MIRSSRRPALAASLVLVLALLGLATGCAGTPQAVINVPSTYTFGPMLILNPSGPTYGSAGGTVVVCVDEHTALDLTAAPWRTDFRLNFDGLTQISPLMNSSADHWVSAPVGPGCGTLSVASFASAQYATSETVTITKAA